MEDILTKYNITHDELLTILSAFQTGTMNNLLRSAYKAPRFEKMASEDFSTYELYEISSNVMKRIQALPSES